MNDQINEQFDEVSSEIETGMEISTELTSETDDHDDTYQPVQQDVAQGIAQTTPAQFAQPIQAKTEKVKKPTQDRGISKMSIARKMVADNFEAARQGGGVPRASVIMKIRTDLGMNEQGANTYYNTAMSEYKKICEQQGKNVPILPRAQTGKPKAAQIAAPNLK